MSGESKPNDWPSSKFRPKKSRLKWAAFFLRCIGDNFLSSRETAPETKYVIFQGANIAPRFSIERPIRSLSTAMQRLRAGDNTARAEPSGPAELNQLAQEFNRLLTERAEAEAALQTQHHALQEAKERADQAMQITQMGLWTWDIRTGTLYADAMLARLFGYEPANLQATPIQQWRERTEPQDLPTLDDRVRACLKGERPQFQIDPRRRHRQGHWLWGSMSRLMLLSHMGVSGWFFIWLS